MATFERALFIFRRDLRLEDNTALIAALKRFRQVIPVFIFDPRQVDDNPYKSDNAIQFMVESVLGLDRSLRERGARLFIFAGPAQDVVLRLLKEARIDAVFFNRDYTPFSVKRDLALLKMCASRGIVCEAFDDSTLTPPGSVVKQAGGPYTVFTPFFKKAVRIKIPKPQIGRGGVFFVDPLLQEVPQGLTRILGPFNERNALRGGRAEAMGILKKMRSFKDYARSHDLPAEAGTTRLSAHLKFGTVSIREVYHAIRKALGDGHPLIRQLYWRDFFTQIAYYFPHVFGNAFYEEYNSIPWMNDKHLFKAWCEGRTGVPIVDAGMRELHTTGFMHNRVRMITASFLVKDLHIDWRWGEKYFAQKLIDYDPAVNNGNWQWAASTGCDHQPYFRIFNPWLQQKRFDPQASYIKKWVPELAAHAAREIHYLSIGKEQIFGYPQPIISHADAVVWSKDVYQAASRRGKKY